MSGDHYRQQSTWQAFKNLVRASWLACTGEKVRFFVFVFLFIVACTLDLAQPWAIGYLLEIFVKSGFTEEAYRDALLAIGAYIGLRVANVICHHTGRYIQNTVAYCARMAIARRVFDSVLRFPLRWHVGHHSGENISRLHRSVGAVDSTIGTYVWQIMEGSVKLIFASTALLALDYKVALNVIALGAVTICFMIFFNKRLVRNIRDNNAFYDKLNRTYVDYLFNIITVKTLKLEHTAGLRVREIQPRGLSISKTISRFQEMKWGSVSVGYGIVLGSSLWIYLRDRQGFQGAFDVAQVYVIINYLDKIFQAIGSFTGYYSGLVEASTAFEEGQKIIMQSESLRPESRQRGIAMDWQMLSIKDLRFRYADDSHSGIRGLHLEIKKGEKIAVVGPSGGGKSTLMKILAGMITPENANVLVDGESLARIEDIGHISLLLPQEPEVFSGSLKYNITMGEDIVSEEFNRFISLCKVDAIVEKLPRGWESDMAEKGLNFSGGEKQRIAMSRGLLRGKDKDILLMDEPTSSLDPMTEKAVFYGLLYHFSDRTIITACHRLALVPLFDKILYIRHGRVEECGSFKELLEKKGQFFKAWEDYEKRLAKSQ